MVLIKGAQLALKRDPKKHGRSRADMKSVELQVFFDEGRKYVVLGTLDGPNYRFELEHLLAAIEQEKQGEQIPV
jgi:hypothetical protein